MNRITLDIPGHQVNAIRRGLLASHEAFAEEVALVQADDARKAEEAGAALDLAQQLRELELLLEQLQRAGGDQTVTGAREPLRVAACDGLVVGLEQLASDAHDYWSGEQALEQLSGQLEAVSEYVRLLRQIERAPTTAG